MRNDRGSVLMLVVIFSIIMSLLGFTVIYMNGQEILSVRREILDARATAAAEAGLEVGRAFLVYCDARLEDAADMNAVGGSTRTAVVAAMSGAGSGVYRVTPPTVLSNSPGMPAQYYEVFISSAVNNFLSCKDPITNGNTWDYRNVYDYKIRSHGWATYGFSGALDSHKTMEAYVRISSVCATNDIAISATSYWYDPSLRITLRDFAPVSWVCRDRLCGFNTGSPSYNTISTMHLPNGKNYCGPGGGGGLNGVGARYFFKFLINPGSNKYTNEAPTQRSIHS